MVPARDPSVPKGRTGGTKKVEGEELSLQPPLPSQGLGEYAACQSKAFVKGLFTFVTGRLGPGVLWCRDLTFLSHPDSQPGGASSAACRCWESGRCCGHSGCAQAVPSSVDRLADGDRVFWQAPVRPWACRCSFRGSLSTPFSGTCWWPWVGTPGSVPGPLKRTPVARGGAGSSAGMSSH